MFKTVLTGPELSTKLNKIIFNNNTEYMDFNIFNKKGISLSGSYILELYNNMNKDMNKHMKKLHNSSIVNIKTH